MCTNTERVFLAVVDRQADYLYEFVLFGFKTDEQVRRCLPQHHLVTCVTLVRLQDVGSRVSMHTTNDAVPTNTSHKVQVGLDDEFPVLSLF